MFCSDALRPTHTKVYRKPSIAYLHFETRQVGLQLQMQQTSCIAIREDPSVGKAVSSTSAPMTQACAIWAIMKTAAGHTIFGVISTPQAQTFPGQAAEPFNEAASTAEFQPTWLRMRRRRWKRTSLENGRCPARRLVPRVGRGTDTKAKGLLVGTRRGYVAVG